MGDHPLRIRCTRVYPTLAVRDVTAAVEFYTGPLGFDEEFRWGDPPIFAGVRLGEAGIHMGQGEPEPKGFRLYFVVDDVDGAFELYTANGVDVEGPPEDREWGMREFRARDLEGHALTLAQYSVARTPPLPIERVDLDARIETRLAALVADVAESKGMTVGEMLEETLLHSFEKMGAESVASPHTDSTLRLIEKLKADHGIDYDAHASYRFTEES